MHAAPRPTSIDNPFAAPRSNTDPLGGSGTARVLRDGKVIVLDRSAELPARCVRCNQPASKKLRRVLSWHPMWVFLLVLFGILGYVLVAFFLRRQAEVRISLCERHARSRLVWIASVWSLVGALFAGAVVLPPDPAAACILFGAIMFLVAFCVTSEKGGVLRAVHIDDEKVRLRGAGEPFLSSLERAA